MAALRTHKGHADCTREPRTPYLTVSRDRLALTPCMASITRPQHRLAAPPRPLRQLVRSSPAQWQTVLAEVLHRSPPVVVHLLLLCLPAPALVFSEVVEKKRDKGRPSVQSALKDTTENDPYPTTTTCSSTERSNRLTSHTDALTVYKADFSRVFICFFSFLFFVFFYDNIEGRKISISIDLTMRYDSMI